METGAASVGASEQVKVTSEWRKKTLSEKRCRLLKLIIITEEYLPSC